MRKEGWIIESLYQHVNFNIVSLLWSENKLWCYFVSHYVNDAFCSTILTGKNSMCNKAGDGGNLNNDNASKITFGTCESLLYSSNCNSNSNSSGLSTSSRQISIPTKKLTNSTNGSNSNSNLNVIDQRASTDSLVTSLINANQTISQSNNNRNNNNRNNNNSTQINKMIPMTGDAANVESKKRYIYILIPQMIKEKILNIKLMLIGMIVTQVV